jgi:hypothetical protein
VAPPKVTHLTNRILQNKKHVQYRWGPGPTYELSAWICDELLVSEDASDEERSRLKQFGWRPKSSVLASAGKTKITRRPGVKDIEIWRPRDPGQFHMVEAVISELTLELGKTPMVSPNHLLVPCGYGSYCSARAPKPLPPQSRRASRIANYKPGADVSVVVIDTGYITKAPLEQRRQRGGFADRAGEVFDGENWSSSPPDGPYRIASGALGLLDGHGTFTAGEIAERCPRVHVTVVGILDPEVSAATEVSVAREILRNAQADVIVPVFAFHALYGLRNWTFTNILPQLKDGSVVVCPTGNESSSAPHYPAALPWPDYPVVGVGSFVSRNATQTTGVTLSDFSNYGDWVFGYTYGEDIPGLYFNLKTKVEDSDPADKVWGFTGWASWAGTSFAAPQVAACLANEAVAGTSPRDAAAQLRANAQQVPLITATTAIPLNGYDLRPQSSP